MISDINDTIKMSHVLNKQELLANIFLRLFRTPPGMVATYPRWAEAIASFYYVLLSPWQIYPSLPTFMDKQRFPRSSSHLRQFRIEDQTFFHLSTKPEAFKTTTIESILHTYPNRRFILVGNSAEKDPNIYSTIVRRYPNQVLHVFIRGAPQSGDGSAHFAEAFKNIPPAR